MTDEENTLSFPIRDQLVDTAVNFLLNPDVQKRHDHNKIEFLKKKGLTEAEITAAFERAKFDPRYNNNFADPKQFENSYTPIPVPNSYVPYSFWSQISNFSSSLIVFGVAIYGLNYFYKKYIKPWLLGEPQEVDSLTQIIIELKNNLAMLTSSVEKLNLVVEKQNEDINKLMQIEGLDYTPTPIILDELKREVSSLKSILISRHQFPAAPQLQQVRASIPAWQLPSAASDQEDQTEQETLCNASDQDLEEGIVNTKDTPSDISQNGQNSNSVVKTYTTDLSCNELNELVDPDSSSKEDGENTSELAVIHDGKKAIANGIHA